MTLSRRAALRGLAVAALAPKPAADAELLALGRSFDETKAAHLRHLEATPENESTEADPNIEAFVNRLFDLTEKITALPAHTEAGLLVKIRVLRWVGYGSPEDDWEDDYAHQLVRQVIDFLDPIAAPTP